MEKRRVALFEFPTRPGVAPLTSAYLQLAACEIPEVRDAYSFETRVLSVSGDDDVQKVLDCQADVYGFSTYVWNSRLVRRILARLLPMRPDARVILGGPQVMHNAAGYLDPSYPGAVLCNGEGEYTFAQYLAELAKDAPDLSRVEGLSYYRDGTLHTNPLAPRIRDLDAIPSPFLTGLIDVKTFPWVCYETNRGCPFKCTYCYWGGATNAKVNKFGLERVFDELTWLCENGAQSIFFIDANFGMLQRDVEIALHVRDLKRRTGFPEAVFINSSKNTPARVTEITRIWSEVGLIAAQPVSLQTMSPRTLKAIERDNIKAETYTALQQTLNSIGLQSFIEMIWPLPGETLASFKEGLSELCRMETDAFVVYQLMLINNVEMAKQRDLYELETIEDPDPNSEAQIVVATADVSREQYVEGINLTYHVTVLYTFMALRHTMRYLDQHGIETFAQTAENFWKFCLTRPDNPYTKFVTEAAWMTGFNQKGGGFIALGGAVHLALHARTEEFNDLLYGYAKQQGWLSNANIRLRFEIDVLNRPLLYSNAVPTDRVGLIESLEVESHGRDSITVLADRDQWAELRDVLRLPETADAALAGDHARLRISYRTPSQIPFSPSRNVRDYYFHCHNRVRGDIRSIWPRWELLNPVDTAYSLAGA
jgi:radical SAM superfamily enzyme YgiQ (UPF0313 family)